MTCMPTNRTASTRKIQARMRASRSASSTSFSVTSISAPPVERVMAIIENLLDRAVEEAREPEGERQRRIIFAGLDGVYRLARDAEAGAELRLAPVPLRAQHLQPVLH